jgi:hypothetical protein
MGGLASASIEREETKGGLRRLRQIHPNEESAPTPDPSPPLATLVGGADPKAVLQEGNPTTGAFSGPPGAAAARGIPLDCRTARGSGTPGAAQAGG